jgi:hypothetical protein
MHQNDAPVDRRRNVQLRLDRHLFDLIENWRRERSDIPPRSHAIEELVRRGLAVEQQRSAFVKK